MTSNALYETQAITARLRAARLAKGFSQRDLARLTGLPQAQLSRIEAGQVDLRLSSLAAIAHALDLEITLVPRKAVPAMRMILSEPGTEQGGQKPAYTLDDEDDG